MLAKAEADQLLAKPVITVSDALKIVPLGRNSLYEAIRRGEIQTVKIKKKILVPAAPLRRLLGIEA